jgi:hypothetical protein
VLSPSVFHAPLFFFFPFLFFLSSFFIISLSPSPNQTEIEREREKENKRERGNYEIKGEKPWVREKWSLREMERERSGRPMRENPMNPK